jgi:hypothetical protein
MSAYAIRGITGVTFASARDCALALVANAQTTVPEQVSAALWRAACRADEAWQARIDGQVAHDCALRERRPAPDLARLWRADSDAWATWSTERDAFVEYTTAPAPV